MGTRSVQRLESIESAYARKYIIGTEKREELQKKKKNLHSEVLFTESKIQNRQELTFNLLTIIWMTTDTDTRA